MCINVHRARAIVWRNKLNHSQRKILKKNATLKTGIELTVIIY